MKLLFLFLTIISFLNISVAQTNYYVNQNLGKDTTANGSAPDSSAWKTIEYAINHVANPTSDSIVINISTGTYNLVSNQIDINRNFLDLILIGSGIDTTVVEADSNLAVSKSRVFEIYKGNNVTLRGMTIQNGNGLSSGGGIFIDSGSTYINYCKIVNNYCSVGRVGGGVGNIAGTLFINNSTITGNTSVDTCYGGGIGIEDGTAQIENSTISYNSSGGGGGIALISVHQSASLEITNSTISENNATYYCGGIRISRFGPVSNNLTAVINSCTIFKNTSTGSAGIGGIGVLSPSSVYVKNSIIGGNISSSGPPDIYGGIISENYNLLQNVSGATITGDTTNNIYGLSPDCQPLALNNSKNGTMTCAIPDSSPARDVIPIDSNGAPLLDQRGANRNGKFDIGAYEFWDNNGALPVELSSFMASVNGNTVYLKWATATEINNRGFQIEKSSNNGFIPLAFISGHGTSTQLNKYTYTDKNVSSGVYAYRLKQIDYNGTYKYSKIVEVNISTPNKFTLSQNYPNPFNPSTTINFTLPSAERVRIIIYNQLGQQVALVMDRNFEAGNHSIHFNGSNLASGVYFYRIKAGIFSQVRKMILLK